jgi:hypothetical protein
VRDSAKEEKALEVHDGRLLRDLAKIRAMCIWPTHCRETSFT